MDENLELNPTVLLDDTMDITPGTIVFGDRGVPGITPHIGENGNWWLEDQDTGVHAQGEPGNDGLTPHIGENGNWWIGNADTGVQAQGADGYTPKKGVDYFDGAPGDKGDNGYGFKLVIHWGENTQAHWDRYSAEGATANFNAYTPSACPVGNFFLIDGYVRETGQKKCLVYRSINPMQGVLRGTYQFSIDGGVNGRTPEKGVDYFTEDEVNDIIEKSSTLNGLSVVDGQLCVTFNE